MIVTWVSEKLFFVLNRKNSHFNKTDKMCYIILFYFRSLGELVCAHRDSESVIPVLPQDTDKGVWACC